MNSSITLPPPHVRRPRLDYDSRAAGLGAPEPGRFRVGFSTQRTGIAPRGCQSPASTLRLSTYQLKVGLAELAMGGIVDSERL